MTDTLVLKLSVEMPWWLTLYIQALVILAFLGVPVNIEKASDRVARHMKVRACG